MKFNHAEAWAVMWYQTEDSGRRREQLWNSRDGVTPFMIRERYTEAEVGMRSMQMGSPELGPVMRHCGPDVCAPQHTPAIDSRIFVDATIEDLVEGYASVWQRYVGEGGKLDPEFQNSWGLDEDGKLKTFRTIVHEEADRELHRHQSPPPCVVIVTKERRAALIEGTGARVAEAVSKGWPGPVPRGKRYA